MLNKNTYKNSEIIFNDKPHYFYLPVREHITSDDIGTYVTYGVSVQIDGREVAFVSDVSTEYEELKRLTDMCNNEGLSLEHLDDVIQDFLVNGSLV